MRRMKKKSIVATGRGVITSVYHSDPKIAQRTRDMENGVNRTPKKKRNIFGF